MPVIYANDNSSQWRSDFLRVLTGIATDSCVVATAMDAKVRDLKRFVPRDCVAAESVERNDAALEVMRTSLGVDTRIGARITVDDFRGTQ